MADPVTIDRAWLRSHPLPEHADATGKDDRGHVLLIGGSRKVPGGLLLSAEAALRAGAGRVQMAAPASLAIPLGLAVPEAGLIALPESDAGEIEWHDDSSVINALGRCECVVIGPAMGSEDAARAIVAKILADAPAESRIVLDATAVCAARELAKEISTRGANVVLTPNFGEAAQLLECELQQIADDPAAAIAKAASMTKATIVLKGPQTMIGSNGAEFLHYSGGGSGMAVSGSGDVLAGILGGLLARGTAVSEACAWAVWLHGQAGRELGDHVGPLGFFARELAGRVPGAMAEFAATRGPRPD